MVYEYGKIGRLYQSLIKNNINHELIDSIMEDGELIKKTSSNKIKVKWLFNAINRMDQLLDNKTKQKIREDCACCLSGKRQTICRKSNIDYKTTEDRINAANESHYVFGNGIKIIGKGKYQVSFFDDSIPVKKCVCVKDLDEKMSITYCYCCGGHVKHHLETVLGLPLKVKTISSALSSQGKKNCVFELSEIR